MSCPPYISMDHTYLHQEPKQPIIAGPRRITAAEVLAELNKLLNDGTYWPHDYNARCGLTVSCDCPKCRLYYDPTGEESAKYLNMDYPSWFNGQGEKPSFDFSKIARESILAHTKPGFYMDRNNETLTLATVIERLTPPLANYPFRILHIAEDYTWDEFVFVNKEGKEYIREKVKYSPHAGMVGEMSYMRRTYKHGRMVWYGNPSDGKTEHFVPFDTANENLRQKLIELFQ